MTTGQKIGATALIIVAFLAMNKCDTDSAHNQPSVSASDDTGDYISGPDSMANEADYTLMESTWVTMPAATQINICAGWLEDQDASVNLFFAGAIASGLDPLPSEATVRQFFSDQC